MYASIPLSWAPVAGATAYRIHAGLTKGGPYDAPGSPKDVGNVTTGTFDVFTGGQWYFAFSAGNASGWSSPAAEITTLLMQPPSMVRAGRAE